MLYKNYTNWKAVSCLENMKFELKGADFKIHFYNINLPNTMIFMAHSMRQNEIRIGIQRKQFNKIG